MNSDSEMDKIRKKIYKWQRKLRKKSKPIKWQQREWIK